MTTYVLRDGVLVPKSEAGPRDAGPYVQSDLPAYKSPLGTGVVEGRAARREELKRSGCREVEPSEYRPVYNSEERARANGGEFVPRQMPVRESVPAEHRAALERHYERLKSRH